MKRTLFGALAIVAALAVPSAAALAASVPMEKNVSQFGFWDDGDMVAIQTTGVELPAMSTDCVAKKSVGTMAVEIAPATCIMDGQLAWVTMTPRLMPQSDGIGEALMMDVAALLEFDSDGPLFLRGMTGVIDRDDGSLLLFNGSGSAGATESSVGS